MLNKPMITSVLYIDPPVYSPAWTRRTTSCRRHTNMNQPGPQFMFGNHIVSFVWIVDYWGGKIKKGILIDIHIKNHVLCLAPGICMSGCPEGRNQTASGRWRWCGSLGWGWRGVHLFLRFSKIFSYFECVFLKWNYYFYRNLLALIKLLFSV